MANENIFAKKLSNTILPRGNHLPFFSGNQPDNAFFGKSNNNEEDREALRSPRFAGNVRLQAAFHNAPVIRQGESGEAVALVQETMVDDGFAMPISTKPDGEMDGIFGSETFQSVWSFQEKHELDTDGIVGHDTLQKMDVIQETDDRKEERKSLECNGIKKFGKDFASSIEAVVFPNIPAARPRDNKPDEMMFDSAGTSGKHVFEINANASLGPFELGDGQKFQHGVIQTAQIMSFKALYSSSKNASRISNNSRDAEPGSDPPWVRNPPAAGGPVPFLQGAGAGKGFSLVDKPRHFFPITHPKDSASTLEKVEFKTVFNFWHVAKETTSDGTDVNNLAFMSNFQITLESEAVKSKVNSNFVGSNPKNRISRAIACGKGPASPVLSKPITIDELNVLKS